MCHIIVFYSRWQAEMRGSALIFFSRICKPSYISTEHVRFYCPYPSPHHLLILHTSPLPPSHLCSLLSWGWAYWSTLSIQYPSRLSQIGCDLGGLAAVHRPGRVIACVIALWGKVEKQGLKSSYLPSGCKHDNSCPPACPFPAPFHNSPPSLTPPLHSDRRGGLSESAASVERKQVAMGQKISARGWGDRWRRRLGGAKRCLTDKMKRQAREGRQRHAERLSTWGKQQSSSQRLWKSSRMTLWVACTSRGTRSGNILRLRLEIFPGNTFCFSRQVPGKRLNPGDADPVTGVCTRQNLKGSGAVITGLNYNTSACGSQMFLKDSKRNLGNQTFSLKLVQSLGQPWYFTTDPLNLMLHSFTWFHSEMCLQLRIQ